MTRLEITNACYFIMTVTSMFCRKSGCAETTTAVNSPVEFNRRALKGVGQLVMK